MPLLSCIHATSDFCNTVRVETTHSLPVYYNLKNEGDFEIIGDVD